MWRKWLARWVAINELTNQKCGFKSHPGHIFYGKDFNSPKTQILLSNLAYGLGYHIICLWFQQTIKPSSSHFLIPVPPHWPRGPLQQKNSTTVLHFLMTVPNTSFATIIHGNGALMDWQIGWFSLVDTGLLTIWGAWQILQCTSVSSANFLFFWLQNERPSVLKVS